MAYNKSFYTNDITLFNANKMNNLEDKLEELYELVKTNKLDILLKYIEGLEPLTAVEYLNKLYTLVLETMRDYQSSILTLQGSNISLSNILVAMYGTSSGISIYGQTRINLCQQVYYFDSSFTDDKSYSLEQNGIRVKSSKSYNTSSYNHIYIGDILLSELVRPNTKYTISFFIYDNTKSFGNTKLKFELTNRSTKNNFGESEEFIINNGWNYVYLETNDFDIYTDTVKKYLRLQLPTDVDTDIMLSHVTLEEGEYTNSTPIFINSSYDIPKSFSITSISGNNIDLNDILGFNTTVEDNTLLIKKIDEYEPINISLNKNIPLFNNLSYEFNGDFEITESNEKGFIEIYLIDKFNQDNIIYYDKIINANGNYNFNTRFNSDIRFKEANIKISLSYNCGAKVKVSNFYLKEENSNTDLSHYEDKVQIDLPVNLYSTYSMKDVILYKDKKTTLIKKLDKAYLNTLTWNIVDTDKYKNQNTILLVCNNPNKIIDIKPNSSIISDRFRNVNDIRDKNIITTGISVINNQIYIRIYRYQLQYYTNEEVKKWMDEHNPFIIFETKNTEEREIDSLPNVKTYDSNTGIYTEEDNLSPIIEISVPISQSNTINKIEKSLKIVENKMNNIVKELKSIYNNNLNRINQLDEMIDDLNNNNLKS